MLINIQRMLKKMLHDNHVKTPKTDTAGMLQWYFRKEIKTSHPQIEQKCYKSSSGYSFSVGRMRNKLDSMRMQ